jgi:hypothetical protein
MSDPEDLNAKASRLWAEFLQTQARAAASLASYLPEMTRAFAQAGAAFPGHLRQWMENSDPGVDHPHDKAWPDEKKEAADGARPSVRAVPDARASTPLSRPRHRRLKATARTLSRRRAPR